MNKFYSNTFTAALKSMGVGIAGLVGRRFLEGWKADSEDQVSTSFARDAAMFVSGATIGAGAAMLFTPWSGPEARERVKSAMSSFSERAKDATSNVEETVRIKTVNAAETVAEGAREIASAIRTNQEPAPTGHSPGEVRTNGVTYRNTATYS